MALSTSKTEYARLYLREGKTIIGNIPKHYRPKSLPKRKSLLAVLMMYVTAEDGLRVYESLLKSEDFLERNTAVALLQGDEMYACQIPNVMHPAIPVIKDLLYEIGWGNVCKIEMNTEGYYQLNFSSSCPFEFELSDRLEQALYILTTDFRKEFNYEWKPEELISYVNNDYRGCFIALRHAVHVALFYLSKKHKEAETFIMFAYTQPGQTINWKEYKPLITPIDRMYAEIVRYRKCKMNLDPTKLRGLLERIKPDDRHSLERFLDYYVPLIYNPISVAEQRWIDDVQKVMDSKGIKFDGIDQRMYGKYATTAKNIMNREGSKVQVLYGRLRRHVVRLHIDIIEDPIKQTISEFIDHVESVCNLEMTFEEFLDTVFDTTEYI